MNLSIKLLTSITDFPLANDTVNRCQLPLEWMENTLLGSCPENPTDNSRLQSTGVTGEAGIAPLVYGSVEEHPHHLAVKCNQLRIPGANTKHKLRYQGTSPPM